MGEVELEEIVVDKDGFWAQEEMVGDVVVPESMGHAKVCGKGCSLPHNTQRCVTSAESSVRRSLTST